MLEAADLISCEPKLDTSKLAPIMLEVPDHLFFSYYTLLSRISTRKSANFENIPLTLKCLN